MRSPRERMVISAALLIRARGRPMPPTAIFRCAAAQSRPARIGLPLLPGRTDPTALRGGRLRRRPRGRHHRRAESGLGLLDVLIDKYGVNCWTVISARDARSWRSPWSPVRSRTASGCTR